ncbi:MAG: hypothetical protein UW65_C0013G0009 [candidate division WWE3 bacterium GW2011_GWB1_44_4]|uniref:Uncharacterized protein n=3 Tax=Katanobacteria TaxID=422282 RepID=A0A0G1KHH9_UNCKA|nr:MAG: hypothetical protein UW65_C0013G0009 [candidate division WWE3 bacterium GW2011_GWB1_44_4]KKT83008.1 MAG: hypothetical protein UW82_C0050G0011 [candidate division WWE3 bacterium GW2011_GWC2_44_9]
MSRVRVPPPSPLASNIMNKPNGRAIELMEQGWEKEREPHRSIWKVSILLTKGLIYYNLHNSTKARKCGKEALAIATTNKLQLRVTQAKAFIKVLND